MMVDKRIPFTASLRPVVGNPFRNTTFVRQFCLMAGTLAAIAILAFFLAGAVAGLAVAIATLPSLLLFFLFARMRYREIAQLAAEMDEVLHGASRIGFSDCREGDVAILRNEAAKLVSRLSRTAKLLEDEKNALADALADVSHQIRTPLTATAIMLENAARARDERTRLHALREAELMLDRISWLVANLLKMAKVDAGALVLEKRLVRAADAVARALDPLELALDARQVTCVVEADDAQFEGDLRWTAEAIENIVKNCMEATSADGVITVQIIDSALAARIVISDTGPGIPEADLPRIFDRFYRGRAAATANASRPHAEGFGIGLSLAQSLVSAQGGSLRAANNPGGGARFEITFPKVTV